MEDKTNKLYTILVVEDDEGLSHLIEKNLKRAGFDVGVTHNGAQAIDWIVNNQTGLMLLDYKLPDMLAGQIVKDLNERQINIPFIIMTGHGDEKVAVEMMKTGAKDYIVKEGEFLDLLPSVVKWIFEELQDEKKLIEAHKALEESEEKYRSFVDNALVGVYKANLKGDILYANKALSKIFEYKSPEEMMLGNVLQTHENKKNWNVLINKHKETSSVDKLEVKVVTRTGKTKNIILSGSLVGDTLSGMIMDVTEKKQIERKLLQTEKLRAMGMMTSGVAHDFNNILAVISGNAQLMEEEYGDHKEMMDELHIIRRAVSDGAEIVRRMRKFTKVERDTSEFMSVDIKEILEQAIEFSRPRWMNIARAGEITYDIDKAGLKEVQTVLGSPSELREVFVNIINNALDAMTGGGRISFCTWRKDYTVFVSISDTGEGMTEEVRKRIFDPFFTTKRAERSGLGMSVAYSIITGHGGKIEVESEAGKGATFTMSIPITREAPQQAVSPEPPRKIKANKLRILVVDDEARICSVLNKYFSRDGHEVRSVNSGTEAIKLLKNEEFGLVLCDLVLPDMSGHDVVKVIDELDKRPKVGLITGWDEKIETKSKEELKVDFLIRKPFDFSKLANHINEALGAG